MGLVWAYHMHGPRSFFFPEGFTFDNIFYIYLCVFIVNEGKEDPNTSIGEPSLANQENAI